MNPIQLRAPEGQPKLNGNQSWNHIGVREAPNQDAGWGTLAKPKAIELPLLTPLTLSCTLGFEAVPSTEVWMFTTRSSVWLTALRRSEDRYACHVGVALLDGSNRRVAPLVQYANGGGEPCEIPPGTYKIVASLGVAVLVKFELVLQALPAVGLPVPIAADPALWSAAAQPAPTLQLAWPEAVPMGWSAPASLLLEQASPAPLAPAPLGLAPLGLAPLGLQSIGLAAAPPPPPAAPRTWLALLRDHRSPRLTSCNPCPLQPAPAVSAPRVSALRDTQVVHAPLEPWRVRLTPAALEFNSAYCNLTTAAGIASAAASLNTLPASATAAA